jgi:replicative DNA helicase
MQTIEKTILSTLFFDTESAYEIIDTLDIEDFNTNAYKEIYKIILDMCDEDLELDIELFNNRTDKKYETLLLDIQSITPISNIKAYIDELKEHTSKFKLQTELKRLGADSELNSTEIIQRLDDLNKSAIYPFKNAINIVYEEEVEAELPSFFLKELLPIQYKEITLITAKGGSGKSYLGLYLLMKLQQQEELKVFGYFSEDSLGITKHRVERLQELHEICSNIAFSGKESRAKPFIEYNKNKNLQPTEFFYKFKKQLKEFDVILLDPLIAFIADDENSNTEARYLMNLLNEWIEKEDKTIILIHHHSKGDNGTARGAGAFVDAVRLHYSVNKIKTEDDELPNTTDRLIKLEKTNHYSGQNEFIIKLFEPQQEMKKDKTTTKRKSTKETKSLIDSTDEKTTEIEEKTITKNTNPAYSKFGDEDLSQFPYDLSVFDGIADSWDDDDDEKKEIFRNSEEAVDEW